MSHPFDRYAAYTDLAALKEASERPLRKCVRVNTLQMSVDDFQERAKQRKWQLEQVPWCQEGFFIKRSEDDEGFGGALGKDLLHLLGHMYLQEASSMLPVELLDPQPDEKILDMSAAPGSKTTQIAAKMRNTGLVIANDMQEKRLWTLKSALHRSGVSNVLVTKKMGQWFGKHMTERFDRVLCDAPCTAQGTSRKDDQALKFSSEHGIGKAAKLQRELLEAAIHACKVGGRIVYSTCTLTPEENEEVIAAILKKFSGNISISQSLNTSMNEGVSDAAKVWNDRGIEELRDCSTEGLVRLWPHTYDTEGFFCAVLEKTDSTRDRERFEPASLQEKPVSRSKEREYRNLMMKQFGTDFLAEHETLYEGTDQIFVGSKEFSHFAMPIPDFARGFPYCKGLKDNRIRITHDLATARGLDAQDHVIALTDDQLQEMLAGKDSTCDSEKAGDHVLLHDGLVIGRALAQNGVLRNRIDRWVVQHSN